MNDHLHPLFRDALNSFARLSILQPPAPLPARQAPPAYLEVLNARVAGIPCRIGVTRYLRVPGTGCAATAPSDLDCTGYTECDYDILDRAGRPAAWLERKATDDDREQIAAAINEFFTE